MNATPKAVRVLRVNQSTQEHEYLMDDGSVQTLPHDQVVWVAAPAIDDCAKCGVGPCEGCVPWPGSAS